MTTGLSGTDHTRVRRTGVAPLSDEQGLRLFDVHDAGPAVLVPARLDLAALRSRAEAGVLPVMLRQLLRRSPRRLTGAGKSADGAAAWSRRLTDLDEPERRRLLVDLVRSEAASVVGHASPSALKVERAFKEAGFDSLTAVELRNRLSAVTGLRLSPTLVFDHPTPAALADHLMVLLAPGEATERPSVLTDLEGLEKAVLAAADSDAEMRAKVTDSLDALLRKVRAIAESAEDDSDEISEKIDSATDDEIFDFIDNEL
jgi:polyketide synthase 12